MHKIMQIYIHTPCTQPACTSPLVSVALYSPDGMYMYMYIFVCRVYMYVCTYLTYSLCAQLLRLLKLCICQLAF